MVLIIEEQNALVSFHVTLLHLGPPDLVVFFSISRGEVSLSLGVGRRPKTENAMHSSRTDPTILDTTTTLKYGPESPRYERVRASQRGFTHVLLRPRTMHSLPLLTRLEIIVVVNSCRTGPYRAFLTDQIIDNYCIYFYIVFFLHNETKKLFSSDYTCRKDKIDVYFFIIDFFYYNFEESYNKKIYIYRKDKIDIFTFLS